MLASLRSCSKHSPSCCFHNHEEPITQFLHVKQRPCMLMKPFAAQTMNNLGFEPIALSVLKSNNVTTLPSPIQTFIQVYCWMLGLTKSTRWTCQLEFLHSIAPRFSIQKKLKSLLLKPRSELYKYVQTLLVQSQP